MGMLVGVEGGCEGGMQLLGVVGDINWMPLVLGVETGEDVG